VLVAVVRDRTLMRNVRRHTSPNTLQRQSSSICIRNPYSPQNSPYPVGAASALGDQPEDPQCRSVADSAAPTPCGVTSSRPRDSHPASTAAPTASPNPAPALQGRRPSTRTRQPHRPSLTPGPQSLNQLIEDTDRVGRENYPKDARQGRSAIFPKLRLAGRTTSEHAVRRINTRAAEVLTHE
jgi:hypothetical protein